MYKNRNLPQVRLADKLKQRIRDGILVQAPPQAGDRIDYVVICGKGKLCDCTEDPDWVQSNPKECKIDRVYYVNQQVRKPMAQLLSPFNGYVGDILDNAVCEIKNQQANQTSLAAYFGGGDQAVQRSREAPSMRQPASKRRKKKSSATPSSSNSLLRFMVKK